MNEDHKLSRLEQENTALQKENAELRQELDDIYREPVWFSHKGDYAVIVALVGLMAVFVFYAIKLWGMN